MKSQNLVAFGFGCPLILLLIDRYKLRNIEETEAAKKLLQEKRLMGRTKIDSSVPSSYSADYFQRGKDYAEKLRRGWLKFLIVNTWLLYFLFSFPWNKNELFLSLYLIS